MERIRKRNGEEYMRKKEEKGEIGISKEGRKEMKESRRDRDG